MKKQLAISELIRAAGICLRSGNSAVRAMGVIHMMRAYGIAEGDIQPLILTDDEVAAITALLPLSDAENEAIGTRQR